MEFIPDQEGGKVNRARWAFNSPSGIAYCMLFSKEGEQVGASMPCSYIHSHEFLAGETDFETHAFVIQLAPGAQFISIRRGVEPWATKLTAIPPEGASRSKLQPPR
jgi:hypothetical protein